MQPDVPVTLSKQWCAAFSLDARVAAVMIACAAEMGEVGGRADRNVLHLGVLAGLGRRGGCAR